MDNKNDLQGELDLLKMVDPSKRRAAFLGYCKKNISKEAQGEISLGDASSRICSTASLYFDDITPEFSEVMDIACDLELPDEHREVGAEGWEKLKAIIAGAQ